MNKTIDEQIELINQQAKELAGLYKNICSELNISENEFWVWYALMTIKGDCSQQEICSSWSLSKQTVNTVITNLMKKGYLYLEVIPGTRNRKRILLTEEGRQYGSSIITPVVNAERRVLEQVSYEEREAAIRSFIHYTALMRNELSNRTL